MTGFTVMIPARYGSSRFPGKPLADLQGRPVIHHVAERATESGAERVLVATDDERIRRCCTDAGIEAVFTTGDHASGTERLGEVVAQLDLADDAIVVNLQGDEPLMPPAFIRRVAEALVGAETAPVATLVTPVDEPAALHNPNVVKVVRDAAERALYFSRAPIPWDRDRAGQVSAPERHWCRHLGIYAYRADLLRRYARLAVSPLESIEALEQLRLLWHGIAIQTATVHGDAGPGVDTPEDLERLRQRLGLTGEGH